MISVFPVSHVQTHAFLPGVAGDRQCVAAISAGIRKRRHLVGGNCSVELDASLHAHAHWVPGAGPDEFFFAAHLIQHRSTSCDGQMGSHILNQNFLFVAKASANARLDDPDAFHRQSQHRSQLPPDMEGHLRARTDHQTVVFIPVSQSNVRFNMRLLHFRNHIFLFKDAVSFRKTFLDVTDIYPNLRGKVNSWV